MKKIPQESLVYIVGGQDGNYNIQIPNVTDCESAMSSIAKDYSSTRSGCSGGGKKK